MERGPSILMVREHAGPAPEYPLPAGWTIRRYRPGDEAEWVRIWMAADRFHDATPERFQQEFGDRTDALSERMLFLCDPEGRAVGTATAWFGKPDVEPAYGMVHWVAIAPEVQGKHLAKPLMSAVMRRLADLAHASVYLVTQQGRFEAVNLYLKFGFVPRIRNDDERTAWRCLRERLPGSPLDDVDLS